MTPIKYIGHRLTYREGCYGSGLVFQRNEVVNLDDDALAAKLLRHSDVYVRAEAADGNVIAVGTPKKEDDAEDSEQDVRDSIMSMNKIALASYASTHFNVDLDHSKKIGELRVQVVGLFDQFGVE